MSEHHALLVFVKNLVYGTVKTRLAATTGNEKAMQVYTSLVAHTKEISCLISCKLFVFYSQYIEENDTWNKNTTKAVQQGNDLGERMKNAFADVEQQGYEKAVIIGTDCPALTAQIIEDAFAQLNRFDVVIGPAADGGYYLLGTKKLHSFLFENIAWSTSTVLENTLLRCSENGLSYSLLPLLHDIDREEDLIHFTTYKHD